MNKEKLFEAIKEAIENMDNGSAVCLWNEYCDAARRYDDRIEDMATLPELFDTSSSDAVFNLLNRFYFGHDENDEKSSANPNRDYFYFNGYGNIVSTDYPQDQIDVDELADWIIEHEDALYNDEIQVLLDEAAEDEEEAEEE